MLLPKMHRIRQKVDPPVVADVAAAVTSEIRKLNFAGRLKPGARVAVTGGSRGVANIATILKATCESMKALGAKPFIVPAMGSHGGATAAKPSSSGSARIVSVAVRHRSSTASRGNG